MRVGVGTTLAWVLHVLWVDRVVAWWHTRRKTECKCKSRMVRLDRWWIPLPTLVYRWIRAYHERVHNAAIAREAAARQPQPNPAAARVPVPDVEPYDAYLFAHAMRRNNPDIVFVASNAQLRDFLKSLGLQAEAEYEIPH